MFLVWTDFESFDLHVLRNNQPTVDIEPLVSLVVTHTVQFNGQPKTKLSVFPASKVKNGQVNIPGFKAIAYFPSWVTTDTFPVVPNLAANGITVDVSTGKVTAQALPPNPPHTITSFGLRVVLFFEENGNVKAHSRQLKLLVHVHNSITKAWTTPSQLNVRPDIIKGISTVNLFVQNPAVNKIKKVNLYKTDAFTDLMDEDLLFDQHPLDSPPTLESPAGAFINISCHELFENRNIFTDNRVFYDPVHLEVTYEGSDRKTRFTLPVHLWYLVNKNDIIKDENGNDLFKINALSIKRQYQLSVYASFDDGTIGDITNWHRLTWTHGPGFVGDDIDFDSNGFFRVPTASAGKTIDVIAKLPVALASASVTEATGKVKVEPSWLTMDLVAKPVPQSPVQTDPDAVNVLFVSEGFDNEAEFTNTARDICKKLRDEHKTAPWNYLFKTAINAWMHYQPSPEKGASVLYETVAFQQVELVNKNKIDLALPLMDLCGFGPNLSSKVSFYQFISRVGLPVPADLNKSKSVKMDDWKQLFGTDIGSGDWNISDDVFNYWKKLGNKRALVEERNTAFGLSCGSKPTLAPRRDSIAVTFNIARMDYQHINQMLSRLRENSATGNLIGEKFWGRDRTGKLGKDFGLLIFLTNGVQESGVRVSQMYYPQGEVNQGISIGLADDSLLALKFLHKDLGRTYPFFKWKNSSNVPAIELVPFQNAAVSISSYSVVTHELGHFFNLLDEYATAGTGKAPVDTRLDGIYNLQHRKSLEVNGKISGEKVKWRWPRISKAAVLALDPVHSSGELTVTVKSGQAAQFKKDEEVHLRKKNILQTPLDKLVSPKLKIIDITNDVLKLQSIQDPAFTGVDFPKGSLLVLLTKASTMNENNPTHDEYAELMSSKIRKRINDTKKGQTKEPCVEDVSDVQEPENLPGDIADPDDHKKIVGLYAGGDEYSCDIFHPTGQCLMRVHKGLTVSSRKNLFTDKLDFTFKNTVVPFCPVCRYSLVDQINPSQHDKIDKLYAPDYPATSWFSRRSTFFWVCVVVGALALVGTVIWLATKEDKPKPGEPNS